MPNQAGSPPLSHRKEQVSIDPCPFCGTKPDIEEAVGPSYFISCPECGKSGNVEVWADEKKDAVKLWNRRA